MIKKQRSRKVGLFVLGNTGGIDVTPIYTATIAQGF
jgi:hypothetical protein